MNNETAWAPYKPLSGPHSGNHEIDIVRAYSGELMPEEQVRTFSHTDLAFATREIHRGGEVKPLQYHDQSLSNYPISTSNGVFDLFDYVSRNRVVGLLIKRAGKVVLEQYELGISPHSRWMSMSMAKSVSTVLVGTAIKDGYISSVDEQLVHYLPGLSGSAYDGVTIRHLMQMTSGAKWDDTHTDPASERRRMLALQIEQKPGAIMEYMASLKRAATPGSVWNYSTGETHIVGALVHAATGKWLSDYLSERIWSRLGMEANANWWLESQDGLEVAGSGISTTLRDYTRFASFILDQGVIDGHRILPTGWVREMGASRIINGQRLDYGYMWWPVPGPDGSLEDGAFSARGIFGQYIYINPKQQLTISVLSSRSKPKHAEAILDNDFFNATVTALRQT